MKHIFYLEGHIIGKISIIFSSIFACILMPLTSGVSAIEFRTITDNINDYDENKLINAIKERIE